MGDYPQFVCSLITPAGAFEVWAKEHVPADDVRQEISARIQESSGKPGERFMMLASDFRLVPVLAVPPVMEWRPAPMTDEERKDLEEAIKKYRPKRNKLEVLTASAGFSAVSNYAEEYRRLHGENPGTGPDAPHVVEGGQ